MHAMLDTNLMRLGRIFTALQLGIALLIILGSYFLAGFVPASRLFGLATNIVLLLLFASEQAQRRLGSMFVPIVIGLAIVGPIIEQYLALWQVFSSGAFGRRLLSGLTTSASLPLGFPVTLITSIWQLAPSLLIPLIIVAWRNGSHGVLAFCLGTALFDLTLLVVTPLSNELVGVAASAIVLRVVTFALVGYLVTWLLDEQRAQRLALAEAYAALVHHAATLEQLAVSRERNRVARELHDTLAHSLSATTVQLEAVGALFERHPERARLVLNQALMSTRAGLTETRRVLHDLRAMPLDELGLEQAVRDLAVSYAQREGWELTLTLPENHTAWGAAIEQSVYRVGQEALTNIARHAQAQTVQITLSEVDDELVLTIQDNGVGFYQASHDQEQRLGLRGMEERAQLIGGTMSIHSTPGSGTMVQLKVRINDSRADL
jgi:signal transduction histidine kinase